MPSTCTDGSDSRVLDPDDPKDLAQLKMWLALDLPIETSYMGEWYLLSATGRQNWLHKRLPEKYYDGHTFRLAPQGNT